MPGAGFEPAKLYAEDLESTPFDRSGTPASCWAWDNLFLTIPLDLTRLNLWDAVAEGYCVLRLIGLARQYIGENVRADEESMRRIFPQRA